MIPILPDQVGSRPADAALKRLFRLVRHLSLPGARAWLSLQADVRPDFLIIDGYDHAHVLTAVGLRQAEADEFLQPGLFELAPSTRTKIERLSAAAERLAAEFPGNPTRILVLHGLTPDTLAQLREKLALPDQIHVIGEPLTRDPKAFAAHLDGIASAPIDPVAATALRACFAPESQVPTTFVPKLSASEHLSANRAALFTGYLLDFNQETWVKNDLLLDDASAEAADSRSRLITGAAGSGKSLALLYRARLLASIATNQRYLFITHNKPLVADLEWRFNHLAQLLPLVQGARIEFRHFFRWCGQLAPSYGDGLTLIYDQDRISLIRQLASEIFIGAAWPESFFVDELALISDQVDDSEQAYLQLDRSGRGIALDASQRGRMHLLYSRYRNALADARQKDWYSIVRAVWEKIREGQITLPRYDLIFIDEGQFFAPIWFAILKRCIAPSGEIIISADPTQGFLKRRQSWRSVGLEVRGRSTRLERSYRSTPAIQSFARRFYQSRATTEGDEEITLPGSDIRSLSELAPDAPGLPRLVHHRAPQDATAWAAAEVAGAIGHGLRPESFLIIHEDYRQLSGLKQAIQNSTVLDHHDAARSSVALTSLNAATGIERPVVILLGLDRLFEKEDDPRLTPQERAEIVRDHTRKVYMALTRPGEKLLISYQNEKTKAILTADA